MVFDEMFKNLLPKKIESLAEFNYEETDVNELYEQWYKLHINKVNLNKTLYLRSDVSFKVLEKMIDTFSEDEKQISDTGSREIAKVDAVNKFDMYKGQVKDNIEGQIQIIESQINDIKSRIETHSKAMLTRDDWHVNLTLSLFDDMAAGKLILQNITRELRVPIYYLFNEKVPQFNLADASLYDTLLKHFPDDMIKDFKGNYSSGIKDSVSVKLIKDHMSKYFEMDMEGYISIPLFTTEEEWRGHNLDVVRQYRLLMLNSSAGALSNWECYPHRTNKGPFFPDTVFEKVKDTDLKFGIMRQVKSTLIEGAAGIMSRFAKYGLANKITYEEKILPLSNPNIY
jgi:hypothetical protein